MGLRQLFSLQIVKPRVDGQCSVVQRVMTGDTTLWKSKNYEECFIVLVFHASNWLLK